MRHFVILPSSSLLLDSFRSSTTSSSSRPQSVPLLPLPLPSPRRHLQLLLHLQLARPALVLAIVVMMVMMMMSVVVSLLMVVVVMGISLGHVTIKVCLLRPASIAFVTAWLRDVRRARVFSLYGNEDVLGGGGVRVWHPLVVVPLKVVGEVRDVHEYRVLDVGD